MEKKFISPYYIELFDKKRLWHYRYMFKLKDYKKKRTGTRLKGKDLRCYVKYFIEKK